MHTLLDLHGNIPTFISITAGKVHDVNILRSDHTVILTAIDSAKEYPEQLRLIRYLDVVSGSSRTSESRPSTAPARTR